jgi:hypothetical protein
VHLILVYAAYNGNLLLMVRVAEALVNPIIGDKVQSIRWDKEKNI